MAVMRLMVLDGMSFRGRGAQFLVGQDDLGCGKKLLCNQNSECRFPKYLGRAGEEVELSVGADINTGSKTLQASVKKNE